jgi:hypothetical protein
LKRLEAKKEKMMDSYYALTKTESAKLPAWSDGVVWKIRIWRIDKTQERIEATDRRIKKHVETTILPLQTEFAELEEEGNMRAALGMKQS